MSFFPIFVDLKDRHFLFIGAGAVAERKIKKLLSFSRDVKITVISPTFSEGIKSLAEKGDLSIIEAYYYNNVLQKVEDVDFYVICTNNPDLNDEIERGLKNRRSFVLRADKAEASNFHFAATSELEGITIAFYSGGNNIGKVKSIRKKMEECFEKQN
jgi:siroheme synthase-like protein